MSIALQLENTNACVVLVCIYIHQFELIVWLFAIKIFIQNQKKFHA